MVATNSRKLKEGGIFLWSWTKYAQNTSDAGEGELARGWGLHIMVDLKIPGDSIFVEALSEPLTSVQEGVRMSLLITEQQRSGQRISLVVWFFQEG